MSSTNIKVVFIAAIGMVLWGGYSVVNSTYIALTWDKVEGTVIDFERHTWSCGKGIGECYALVVGYEANGQAFTTTSVKKYSRSKPSQLLKSPATVYYSSLNPGEAILGGAYGPMRKGIWLLIIGTVILVVFWVVKKREG